MKTSPKLPIVEKDKKEIFTKNYVNNTDSDVFRRLNDDDFFSYSPYLSEEQRQRAFESNYKTSPLSENVDRFMSFLSNEGDLNSANKECKKQSDKDLFEFYLGEGPKKINWKTLFRHQEVKSSKQESVLALNRAYTESFGDGQMYEIKSASVSEEFLLHLKENPSKVIFGVLFLLFNVVIMAGGIFSSLDSYSIFVTEFLVAFFGYLIVLLSVLLKLLLVDGLISKILKTSSFLQDGIKSEIIDRRKKKFAKILDIGSKNNFKYENREGLFSFLKMSQDYIEDLNKRLITEPDEVRIAFSKEALSIEKDLLLYKEALLSKSGYEIKTIRAVTKIRNKIIKNISTERRFKIGFSGDNPFFQNISRSNPDKLYNPLSKFHKNRILKQEKDLNDDLMLPVMFVH